MSKQGQIEVLYEDNHLIFVKKPCNMPVQADSSGDTDLQSAIKSYLKSKYNKPGEVYLGLVHRLDRPVGGVMVFCKTSKAAARISEQIRQNQMGKTYLAVVQGSSPDGGTLSDYLIKNENTNTVSVCSAGLAGAKYAELSFETIGRKDGFSLVKIALKTGRSHQIRVQMKNAGFPLWGDNRYGSGKPGQQIALWSCSISLIHPTKKEAMTISAPSPDSFPWTLFAGEQA